MHRPNLRAAAAVVVTVLCAAPASAQKLSPNAPADRPEVVTSDTALRRLFAEMQPMIDSARATYPQAKARFLAGLPAGYNFFVVTRLHDAGGRTEQVFVWVDRIEGSTVYGHIASDIGTVEGYHRDDLYSFPETKLVDWLIARPDGSEEGNYIGKWADARRAAAPPR